jgi:predicted ABC-type ATPase
MIARELEALVAAGERRVRTPEGAEHYGQPIGSIITTDLAATTGRMKARVAKASASVGRTPVDIKTVKVGDTVFRGKGSVPLVVTAIYPKGKRTNPGGRGWTPQVDMISTSKVSSKNPGKTLLQPISDFTTEGPAGETKRSPMSAYPSNPRTPDGRVILNEDLFDEEGGDFRSATGPHSMLAHVEVVELPDGTKVHALSKEREALHDELMRRTLEGIKPPPAGRKPRALFLGGGSGAGKGTATKEVPGYPRVRELHKSATEPPGEAAVLDADAYKMALPEWGQPDSDSTASFTHEESSLLVKAANDAAIRLGIEYVLDGTGDGSPKSMAKKIAKAKAAGYRADAVYVTVPTPEAMIRTLTRGLGNGRLISLDIVSKIHASVSSVAEEVQGLFDTFNLYNANVPIGTVPPIIVKDGKVVDKDEYDAFLDKKYSEVEEGIREALRYAQTRVFQPIKNDAGVVIYPPDEAKAETIRRLQNALNGILKVEGR